jgi:hypothetical protein
MLDTNVTMRWLPGCFRDRHRWGLAAEANAVAEPEQRSAVSNGTSLRLSSTERLEDGTRPKSSAMIAHPCRVAPRRQLWRQSREAANIIAAVSRYERRLIGNRHQDEEPGAGEQQRVSRAPGAQVSGDARRSPLKRDSSAARVSSSPTTTTTASTITTAATTLTTNPKRRRFLLLLSP